MVLKVQTENAPAAIGPYSQAVRAGDFLYVSGQLPIDPSTGNVIAGGIKEQTAQVISNIEAILRTQLLGILGEEGNYADLGDVVRTDVFLSHMDDFKDMNAVYASRFKQEPLPARQIAEVSKLPRNVMVEISCIAYVGGYNGNSSID